MTQDKIIKLACGAGLGEYLHLDGWRFTPDGDDIKSLERFFNLAFAAGAAHEREKIEAQLKAIRPQGKSWLPMVLEAVLAEREACARVCEKGWKEGLGVKYQGDVFAAAIRARGNNVS